MQDLNTGEETGLTQDGVTYAGYADSGSYSKLDQIRSGIATSLPPLHTHWSPDSRWIITRYLDERQVEPYVFLESVRSDGGFRPKIHEVRTALLGDSKLPQVMYFIIDVNNRTKKSIRLSVGFDFENFTISNKPLGWNEDASKAYLYISTSNGQEGRIVELDMRTGNARNILKENAPGSRVNLSSSLRTQPSIKIFGNELIWYSERSNWGHLYLYDIAKGKLIRRLTKGDWAVHSIVHIDAARRNLIISGVGKEQDTDLYQRRLYRVSLDGGAPVLLTPESANHNITPNGVSPSGNYFVQSISTISEPPRTVLRHVWKSAPVIDIETADASALYALGWSAPQRVRIKAADGKTELYAVVFAPNKRFKNFKKLPVLDANYMNSIFSVTPVDFMSAVRASSAAAMTRLGFYVVVVDGRGTPLRSRAFREAGYPAFYDIQIEDHVSAIRQLSVHNVKMDLSRVGIYGHSNGGSGAARSILKQPDFFSVAVASAGSHDYMSLPPSGVKFFGNPVYENAGSVRPSVNAIPKNYISFDNTTLAENLSGHLLLAYADMDNAALPSTFLRLADALTKAGKRYDLIYMANEGHRFLYKPYFLESRRMYFVEHLHGIEPPM